MSKRSKLKYYRILDDLNQTQYKKSSKLSDYQLQQLTKSLMKKQRYMYIDINEDRGYKVMEQCNDSDEQGETEQIGKKYVVYLDNLSNRNSQNIIYLLKTKQQEQKKKRVMSVLIEELNKSAQKIKKLGKIFFNKQALYYIAKNKKPQIYKGMDNHIFQIQKYKEEYLEINRTIKYKQKMLIQKYNKISTRRSQKESSLYPIKEITAFKMKIALPTIKSSRRSYAI